MWRFDLQSERFPTKLLNGVKDEKAIIIIHVRLNDSLSDVHTVQTDAEIFSG